MRAVRGGEALFLIGMCCAEWTPKLCWYLCWYVFDEEEKIPYKAIA